MNETRPDTVPPATGSARLPRRLDLGTIRLFATVCRTRSIAHASRQECLTASAVSKRIRMLESTLDCTLLSRRPDGVAPTPAGRVLASLWREVEFALYDLPARLQGAAAAPLEEVVIGCRGPGLVAAVRTAYLAHGELDAHAALVIDRFESLGGAAALETGRMTYLVVDADDPWVDPPDGASYVGSVERWVWVVPRSRVPTGTRTLATAALEGRTVGHAGFGEREAAQARAGLSGVRWLALEPATDWVGAVERALLTGRLWAVLVPAARAPSVAARPSLAILACGFPAARRAVRAYAGRSVRAAPGRDALALLHALIPRD